DGRAARRLDLLGLVERLRELGLPRDPARGVIVGVVVAVLATNEDVLAGLGRRHEARGFATAHDPGLRLDVVRLEPTALPDPLVGPLVRVEAPVEPKGAYERIWERCGLEAYY